MIASNATVPSMITLGKGAVLRNFGGMSAVRVTDQAKLVMKSGSVIEDEPAVITTRGSDADKEDAAKGPAGAVWLQGGSFTMEAGTKIQNVNGRAVYVDGGEAHIGGTISGITGNPAMWQGTNGTAIHLRNNATGTLTVTGLIANVTGDGSNIVYLNSSTYTMDAGSIINNLKNQKTHGIYSVDSKADLRNEVRINGEIYGINGNPLQIANTNVYIGETGNIHDNFVNYGALYLQKNATADIYGKINNNTATGRGGGIGTAGHGFVEINLYSGSEIKDNNSDNTSGGMSLKNCRLTMFGGEISNNTSKTLGGGIFLYEDASAILREGLLGNNMDNRGSNDLSITAKKNGNATNYLYISDKCSIENPAVYMESGKITVEATIGSRNLKLHNASKDSITSLTAEAQAKGWSSPLATFWAQRDGTAELTVDGLTPTPSLPVYGLVQETGADGKPASGAEVRVYSTEITADGIRLTLPNGYTNGCAVALTQPAADFGSVVISGPTEIAKTSDAATYEVPYTVTYTMSDSLLSMLQMTADIKPMSFVVELDSRPSAKVDDIGNCLYTFNGGGILSGTASVSGHTVTLTCDPLPGWKTAITGSASVTMTLQCTGLLDAAAFAAGESLNTSAHISGTVSDGSTVTPVMIPSNVCRTRMTAHYSVFYHGNEADSGETVDSRSYIFGDLAVVSENGYVRDGHSFVGWNTQRDGSGTHHVPGSSITVTDHIHLYAQWTRNSSRDDDDKDYFAIQKVDAQDGHALNGATFELYQLDKNDRIVNRRVVRTRQQSSENGIALFGVDNKNSYDGIWYYAEVSAPDGYVLDRTEYEITAKDFSDSLSTAVRNADTVRNYRGTTPDLLNDSDHFAYVIGSSDALVRPNDNITRAGVATIFFRLLKDSVRDANLLTSNTYTDVPADYWANTAISTMTGLGIVQGRSTTTFDPKAPITRAQFAAICARFDTGKSSGTQSFTDIKGHWAEKYIERAAELGWIKGFEDGTFRPDTYITRVQAMTMINRVLNRIPEDASDLLSDMNVWPDCKPGDWFYLAIQEATNSHDFKHKAGNYETWTGMNKDPDWTRYEN